MADQDKYYDSSNLMQRVKVYRLNEDGEWDDHGIGYITVDYLERSKEPGLFVFDEEDDETLLQHSICRDDIYHKQEDTIISWKDPELCTELALSFQETAGCSYIWENICNAQRTGRFKTSSCNDTFRTAVIRELQKLPTVELSTLHLILKIVGEGDLEEKNHVVGLILQDQEFFPMLMDLFRTCEDLGSIETLHVLFNIVRGIILLNSRAILEKIFGDDLIMDTIGCLEYEPDIPHFHHREFINEQVVFNEAIPIKEQLVLSKIHQTYRLGYIKDVVLQGALNAATLATLNIMIDDNNAFVVSKLQDNKIFILELFSRLKSLKTDLETKKILVSFLLKLCSVSRSLRTAQHLDLFKNLVSRGIIDVIIDILPSVDKQLVLIGTDILILFLNEDPSLLRSYVNRPEGIPLLGLLVQGMITNFGDDMHCHFLEGIRSLLDSKTVSGLQVMAELCCLDEVTRCIDALILLHLSRMSLLDSNTIVEEFYEKHFGQLIEIIKASCSSETDLREISVDKSDIKCPRANPEILLNISDLLCFCAEHHPARIKTNFLQNRVFHKVLLLTKRREKYLVVAAVQIFHAVVSHCDNQLHNYIVKHNLLKPLIDAFVENGQRYNMLHSAVRALLEYIKMERHKALIKYVVESFWHQLRQFENLVSIKSFKLIYDQSLNNTGKNPSVSVLDSREGSDWQVSWNEEDDDVHDDEDDINYSPPLEKLSDDDDGMEEIPKPTSLKRKIMTEEDFLPVKRLKTEKNTDPTSSGFAALTLSQSALPSTEAASMSSNVSKSPDAKKSMDKVKHEEKWAVLPTSISEESLSGNGRDK